MREDWNTIKMRFGRRARTMLEEFANTRSGAEAFERFKRTWKPKDVWVGDENYFRTMQERVRETWENKKRGVESILVELWLGLHPDSWDEEGPRPQQLVHVDWKGGGLYMVPRNLNDMVWLTLLQNSRRLGICANRGTDPVCPTPYFIKYRPQQQFCSENCALPKQREHKLNYWKKNRDRIIRAKKSARKPSPNLQRDSKWK